MSKMKQYLNLVLELGCTTLEEIEEGFDVFSGIPEDIKEKILNRINEQIR